VTPEQLALVRDSYSELDAKMDEMAPEFYRQLFALDPSLRAMFMVDWPEQEAKFTKQMTEIVNALGDLERLMEQTMALGLRHVAYGVKPSHYATVRTALLNTFGVLLGDRFDAATHEAWVLAYNLISECMLSGATEHPR
jgi:hemoglobin-like flavoprotein